MKKKPFLFFLVITFCISLYTSAFWFQLELIQGSSMAPAYHSWQLVILYKQPVPLTHGDVITFRVKSLNTVLVKRIVACPGDTVQIENGTLYVNGVPSRIIPACHSIDYAGIAQTPITLTSDEYFVLGDNYSFSKDSRYPEIGCILEKDILGKVYPQISFHQ